MGTTKENLNFVKELRAKAFIIICDPGQGSPENLKQEKNIT